MYHPLIILIMKKSIILSAFVAMAFTANAQTTVQGSKFTDNWSVGLRTGIITPVTHSAFFKNARPALGIEFGKQLTPVFGLVSFSSIGSFPPFGVSNVSYVLFLSPKFIHFFIMRPDRIIVGEVRDAAAIDMLQALNTGHNGMSTGHSNSPADMLSRLETMVLLGTDIPLVAVRKQIASAIDIVIHLGRLRDKSRRVLEIAEVLDCVDGEIELNRIFEFVEEGVSAEGKIVGNLKGKAESLIRRQKLNHAGLIL